MIIKRSIVAGLLAFGLGLTGAGAIAAIPSPYTGNNPPPIPQPPKQPTSTNQQPPPPPPGFTTNIPDPPLGVPPDDPPSHAPEPASVVIGMIGASLTGLYGLRRRRKA